jgi:hypothetical protein
MDTEELRLRTKNITYYLSDELDKNIDRLFLSLMKAQNSYLGGASVMSGFLDFFINKIGWIQALREGNMPEEIQKDLINRKPIFTAINGSIDYYREMMAKGIKDNSAIEVEVRLDKID